jgi:hypothetical protein
MKAIEIQTDNEEIPDSNPSPSKDPYFENPENLAEIEKGLIDVKEGRVVKLDQADRKKYFESLKKS